MHLSGLCKRGCLDAFWHTLTYLLFHNAVINKILSANYKLFDQEQAINKQLEKAIKKLYDFLHNELEGLNGLGLLSEATDIIAKDEPINNVVLSYLKLEVLNLKLVYLIAKA